MAQSLLHVVLIVLAAVALMLWIVRR